MQHFASHLVSLKPYFKAWFPIPGQVSENDEFLFLGCDGVFELYSSEALTLPYAAVCKFAYPDSQPGETAPVLRCYTCPVPYPPPIETSVTAGFGNLLTNDEKECFGFLEEAVESIRSRLQEGKPVAQ